jgi:hypothetical protein
MNIPKQETYIVLLLALCSLMAFYPAMYILNQKHKNKGFEIVFLVNIMITNTFEKICIALNWSSFFVSSDSWHKLCNIAMLTQFLCLMVYLARIPDKYKGVTIGIGMGLIIMFQEKDSFSFKYALIPMIFNNLLLIGSSCLMTGPTYVNSRCVAYGMFWYILSIFCFLMSYFQYFDFLLLFDDGFIMSTGLSLFYSW